jgi:P2 family phage contractile tail tube protein
MIAYKVTNGNVYLDGITLVGKFDELTLPDLAYKTTEYKTLGMLAEIELPSGFEKMEAEINFLSVFAAEFSKIADPTQPVNLTFRGNKEGYDSMSGRIESNVTITIRGIGKNFPLGGFKTNEMSNFKLKMTVWSISVSDGGVPVLRFDAMSNTFVLGGKDLSMGFKLNT